jgi:hypothetical protein
MRIETGITNERRRLTMRAKRMVLLVLLAAWGCGEEVTRIEPVALDKLPAGSLEMAKSQLPDVTFDRARKVKFNGADAYEIVGKDKRGKIREVEVSTTGKLLEIE